MLILFTACCATGYFVAGALAVATHECASQLAYKRRDDYATAYHAAAAGRARAIAHPLSLALSPWIEAGMLQCALAASRVQAGNSAGKQD